MITIIQTRTTQNQTNQIMSIDVKDDLQVSSPVGVIEDMLPVDSF